MTSTVIFQVSRYLSADTSKSRRPQLRLKERFNSSKDRVTALATLHIEDLFLSGMHFAYRNSAGELFFSFDKEDEEMRVDFNINFYENQLVSLQKQITSMGTKLTKPPKDEHGVSELRGVQLQVVLRTDYETSLVQLEDDFYSKLVYKITPQDIVDVKLVCTGETGYVEAPGHLRMKGDLAIQAVYKKAGEGPATPQTLEEAKSAIQQLTRAQKRGANRHAARQAARAAAALAPAPTPEKATIVLSDDDDDDEQPE